LNCHHETIDARIEVEIQKAYRYHGWVFSTVGGEATSLLRKTLGEKAHKTLDRLFRLLAMRHPPKDLYAAWQALSSPNARIRANAVEYLDNILRTPQKKLVLALVEEKPTQERIERGLRDLGESGVGWPNSLARQAASDDDWLAACALHTVWATEQRDLFELIEMKKVESLEERPLVKETLKSLRRKIEIDTAKSGDGS
jgi:hypothetical protein